MCCGGLELLTQVECEEGTDGSYAELCGKSLVSAYQRREGKLRTTWMRMVYWRAAFSAMRRGRRFIHSGVSSFHRQGPIAWNLTGNPTF